MRERSWNDCLESENSLTYYGKKMDFETAKNAIERSKKLIGEMKQYARLQ